jgi:hypothetical protein
VTSKLAHDAFAYYIGLGAGRSYRAVADHYGVDKKTVIRRAAAEDWQKRILEIDRKAREGTEQKAQESLEAMNDRHLKTLRAIQGKALEALRLMPITSASDAIRALVETMRQERLVRGEPSERTAISVEDTIRREYERWMERDDESLDRITDEMEVADGARAEA